jgi:hypothetical protein
MLLRKRFRVDNFIYFTLIFYEMKNKKAAKFELRRFYTKQKKDYLPNNKMSLATTSVI